MELILEAQLEQQTGLILVASGTTYFKDTVGKGWAVGTPLVTGKLTFTTYRGKKSLIKPA